MKKIVFLMLTVLVVISGCKACQTRDESKIGTEKIPLKIGFMPAPEKGIMEANVKTIIDEISKESGLKIEPVIAKDYMSLIDGLSSKTIDVAFINSLGYLLAHDFCKAEALFQLKGEDGRMVYNSAVIAGVNSGVKTINDITGKSFTYSDPFSLTGYLIPLSVFTENKIVPSSTTFAGGYSDVVELVYNGKAAAGAIYYAEHDPDGRIHDARVKLVNKYNDMLDKVLIIFKSDPVPTTPITFRKDLNAGVKDKIVKAFERSSVNPSVISALNKLYGATGIMLADPKNYDKIRDVLKKLGKDVKEVVPGAVEFYKKHFWDVVPTY